MADQKAKPGRPRSVAPSEKRQFLVYLAPETVKAVKVAAIERDTSASALVDEILQQWLKKK